MRTESSISTSSDAGDGDQGGLDFNHVRAVLRRRIGLILVCAAAAAIAALAFSLIQDEKYEATASLLFRAPKFGLNIFGDTTEQPTTQDVKRQAATNVELVKQDAVYRGTARAMGEGLSFRDVKSEVSVSDQNDSDIVAITASGPDPETAKKLANTFAAQFVSFRVKTDRDQVLESKAQIDKLIEASKGTGADTALMKSGADQLGWLADLQTGNVEIVQLANEPVSPASPKPGRNTVFGLLAGLVIGLLAAFIAERLDRRLRSPDDVERTYGLPVLGVIPENDDIADSNRGVTGMDLPFAAAESFRMIRASLRYFNVDQEIRVVMVTSEVPMEGKSTVAWNLAHVAALSGKTLLIETDLRRPSFANQHKISPAPGLAEYLTHQVGLEEAIQNKLVFSNGNGGNGSDLKLDIIAAGTPPPNPSELLGSRSMAEFIDEVKSKYDLIVIDTAPVGIVSDPLAVGQLANGALIVARIDMSMRESAVRLKQRLQQSHVPILGVVANGVRVGKSGAYGAEYGYLNTDYSSQAPASPPTAPSSAEDVASSGKA